MRIETGHRLARRLAWLFCNVLRVRGAVVDDNLAHAFPGLSPAGRSRLARRMWEHLFLFIAAVAALAIMAPELSAQGCAMCKTALESSPEGRALAERAPIDLRANRLKGDREKALKALAHLNPEETPLSPLGIRLNVGADGRGR